MSQQHASRRRFLKVAGISAGGLVLACGGLTAVGLTLPKVDPLESTCGEAATGAGRILVAYASRSGTAGEVANTIAKTLCDAGAAADVRQAKDVDDLSHYRAVIVGSAIYMDSWMGAAKRFVQKHAATLAQMPVAYFNVCLTMKDDTPENRATTLAYVDPLHEAAPGVTPLDVGLFAGALRPEKLPWLYRAMASSMPEAGKDYRDENAIRAWAAGLASQLGM